MIRGENCTYGVNGPAYDMLKSTVLPMFAKDSEI
jgi:hypothetical protein